MQQTARKPRVAFDSSRSWLGLLSNGMLWCFGILCLSGCQSGVYRAAKLPSEFRTPTVSNHAKINLSNFASAGISDSIITGGDLLEVTILTGRQGESLAPKLARVSDDGIVLLSAIGPVHVAGLQPFEASQNIVSASTDRGIYRAPKVTIRIKTKAVTHITVLGEVNDPGVHEISRSSSDLIRALGAAGGLTDDASTSIEIIRHASPFLASNDRELESVPLEEDMKESITMAAYENLGVKDSITMPQEPKGPGNIQQNQGQKSFKNQRIDLAQIGPRTQSNYRLGDRDVVVVHPREKRFLHVSGLVKKPGQFEMPNNQDIYLLDALALAGGLSSIAADKIFIIRRIDGQPKPLVIKASWVKAKHEGRENIRLAAGDMINVEHTPATLVMHAVSTVFRITMGITSTAFAF